MFGFFRPAPKFETGTMATLHNGGYVLIKRRRWVHSPRRGGEWAYDVIKIKGAPSGELLYVSSTYNMSESHIKWEVFS